MRTLAIVTVVAAVAAVLTGSRAVAADADVRLGYTCGFPSGDQPVAVHLVGTFPDTAVLGDVIQPTDVTLTVTLPRPALDDLTAIGAATVAVGTDLTVAIDEIGEPYDTFWPGQVPATPIPAEGELELMASGDVPATFPSVAGVLTFTAGAITLQLAPQREDGSATDPPLVVASCTLDPGQDAFLAGVTVTEGSTEPPPGTPEECGDLPPLGPGLATGCAFVIGRANVAKLDGSVAIEAGLMNIALNDFEIHEGNLLIQRNVADMPAGGLPPTTGTFLAFGFVPVKATMELTQVGPIPVTLVAQGGPPFLYWIGVEATMSLRVRDVTVNGVPLDVGPNCRSARDLDVELVGGTPEYNSIFLGGPLYGLVEIPPFSGCGVGEDLDPLLSGAVSGPGNYIRMTQGNVCTPVDPWFCPPVVPEPQR